MPEPLFIAQSNHPIALLPGLANRLGREIVGGVLGSMLGGRRR